eukprot:1139673-Prymnesium_polylepis.1
MRSASGAGEVISQRLNHETGETACERLQNASRNTGLKRRPQAPLGGRIAQQRTTPHTNTAAAMPVQRTPLAAHTVDASNQAALPPARSIVRTSLRRTHACLGHRQSTLAAPFRHAYAALAADSAAANSAGGSLTAASYAERSRKADSTNVAYRSSSGGAPPSDAASRPRRAAARSRTR